MEVFLSYSRRDSEHAVALNNWLTSQGVTTFFDQRDLPHGQLWLPELERRIETDVQAVAVLIGPAGLGNTQQYEVQLALTRQAAEQAFPVIPVILPGTQQWRIPRGFLGLQTWIDFRASTNPLGDPIGLQRLLAAVRRQALTGDSIRGSICPYKGLEFFSEEDEPVFFGRDVASQTLYDTVIRHNVAAVIGRSGSGKSSLVRAGLLPRLRRARSGGGVWDSLVFRPGEDPLGNLVKAFIPPPPGKTGFVLAQYFEEQAEALREARPDFLARFVRDRLSRSRLQVNRLLIVIDQAEELFATPWHLTTASDIRRHDADAVQFVKLLLGVVLGDVASLVLTIRSDFFDPLMHSPFADHLRNTQVHLSQIQNLRPSIEGPAALVGLTLAEGLAEKIVADVGGEETNLPLMQHALERTWQNRTGHVLTHDGYAKAGGVAQAINRAASDCYAELRSDRERDAARHLFLRLVRPEAAGSNIRVTAVVPDDPDERRVMEVFARPERRLLFVGTRNGVPVVDVAHEALVRGWDMLRSWVEVSRDKLRVRDAVMNWMANAGPDELLPPGSTVLRDARALVLDPGDVRLDPTALAYITRSAAEQDRATRRRRWMATGMIAASFTFVAILTAAIWIAINKQNQLDNYARTKDKEKNGDGQTFVRMAKEREGVSVDTIDRRWRGTAAAIERMQSLAGDAADLLHMKLAVLTGFTDSYIRIGEWERAESVAKDAVFVATLGVATSADGKDQQRDLATAYDVLGDVLLAEDQLAAALVSFRKSLAIRQRLVQMEPVNMMLQDELSVSYSRVGSVLEQQNRFFEAAASYLHELEFCEGVARSNRGNMRWQRNRSIPHEKLAQLMLKFGNPDGARAELTEGRRIIIELQQQFPDRKDLQGILDSFDAQLSALKH